MPTQADHTITRCIIETSYDSEDQMTCEAPGRKGERFGGSGNAKAAMPILQNYGRTTKFYKGCIGSTHTPDGNPDKAMASWFEDPAVRPKNLTDAEWKDYDKWGHYLHARQADWTEKVGNAIVKCIESGGVVHINPPSSELLGLNPPLTPLEFATMEAEERDAEANRQKIVAEAQQKFAAREDRISTLENRIAELEARLNALDSKTG